MQEKTWLSCQDPQRMMDFLREKKMTTARKRRLLACGCCRHIWHLLPDEESRQAVKVAEQYADGLAGDDERVAAREAHANQGFQSSTNGSYLYQAVRELTAHPKGFRETYTWSGVASIVANDEFLLQLIHDLFGDPLRPVIFNPAWRTPSVIAIAQTSYDEHRFEDMPILGDALEESGCTNDTILVHCRTAGVHVRGCWVIDRILGKG